MSPFADLHHALRVRRVRESAALLRLLTREHAAGRCLPAPIAYAEMGATLVSEQRRVRAAARAWVRRGLAVERHIVTPLGNHGYRGVVVVWGWA